MFKTGDLVVLKSGGPKMVVRYTQDVIGGDGIPTQRVYVSWATKEDIIMEHPFIAGVIKWCDLK